VAVACADQPPPEPNAELRIFTAAEPAISSSRRGLYQPSGYLEPLYRPLFVAVVAVVVDCVT